VIFITLLFCGQNVNALRPLLVFGSLCLSRNDFLFDYGDIEF
jgi:hypothetical protein